MSNQISQNTSSLRGRSFEQSFNASCKTINFGGAKIEKIFDEDLDTRRDNPSSKRRCKKCPNRCNCNIYSFIMKANKARQSRISLNEEDIHPGMEAIQESSSFSTLCSQKLAKLNHAIQLNAKPTAGGKISHSEQKSSIKTIQNKGIDRQVLKNALLRFRSKSVQKPRVTIPQKNSIQSTSCIPGLKANPFVSPLDMSFTNSSICGKSPKNYEQKTNYEMDESDSLLEAPLCNRRYSGNKKFSGRVSSMSRLTIKQDSILNLREKLHSGMAQNYAKNSPMKSSKMPLPLYPKKKKPILAKVNSQEVGMSPLQSFGRAKLAPLNPKNVAGKKKPSADVKRTAYKKLCKGNVTSGDSSPGIFASKKLLEGRIVSNLSTYKPLSQDSQVCNFSAEKSVKLPKISSNESMEMLSKLGQEVRLQDTKPCARERILKFSSQKNCQNERFPKYKFSFSTKASLKDSSSGKSIAKISELNEKIGNDSRELPQKRFDSLDEALIEIPDEENDTFCLNDTLGSIFTSDKDDVLSVSDDSVLSEVTMKAKKRPRVIKLRKKAERKAI